MARTRRVALSWFTVFLTLFFLTLVNNSMIFGAFDPNYYLSSDNIYPDDFNSGIEDFWQNPYQFNNSDDWEWVIVDGTATPTLLPSCDDYTASALTQSITINGVFDISVDIFKLSALTTTSLQLRLLDDKYEPVAIVGIKDTWTNESYQEYSFISMPLEGEGVAWRSELRTDDFDNKVSISRDAVDYIHVTFGGIERLSLSNTKQVAWIELYIADTWAKTFDQEVILQSNYHWFDNFHSQFSEEGNLTDLFDESFSPSWQVTNPIHTDDDWEWVNDYERAVPKLLPNCDNYSPTALEQLSTEPIIGPFDFSVEIYKNAENTGTSLSLLLYDEYGNKLAAGGVYDPWSSSYYKKFGQVYTPSNIVIPYKTDYIIGGEFKETIRIWRDLADIVHVSLNNQEVVSTYNPHGVKMVRLDVYIKHATSDQELINQVESQWFDNFIFNKDSSTIESSTSEDTSTLIIQITSGLQWFPSLFIIFCILSARKSRRKDI